MPDPTRDAGEDEKPDYLTGPAYAELRRVAERMIGSPRGRHTLPPTAVVHEAYLKLACRDGWKDERHFQAVAARAVRQVLVDYARQGRRLKRGGDARRVALDTSLLGVAPATDIVDLHDALEALEREDARAARLVELRFFGDLTMPQAAAQLGVPLRTAEREWRFARAWLHQALRDAIDET